MNCPPSTTIMTHQMEPYSKDCIVHVGPLFKLHVFGSVSLLWRRDGTRQALVGRRGDSDVRTTQSGCKTSKGCVSRDFNGASVFRMLPHVPVEEKVVRHFHESRYEECRRTAMHTLERLFEEERGS